jgi:type IV pilus assembly protein PilA
MIVVAIIGILAAIAIPNFLNFRLKAKMAEARSNMDGIRTAEVAHYAENEYYVTGASWTPWSMFLAPSHDVKQAWDATTRFSQIGFAPEGKVYFMYALDGDANPVGVNFSILTNPIRVQILAASDLDTDWNWSIMTFTIPDDPQINAWQTAF